MKTDLDSLMRENEVDVIWVMGSGKGNPCMAYLSSGAQVTKADIFKKIGEKPTIFHSSIERENIHDPNLNLKCYSEYPLERWRKESRGDQTRALSLRYGQMLKDLGIETGSVSVCGMVDAGKVIGLFSQLKEIHPSIQFSGDPEKNLLLLARATKDPSEIDCMREIAKINVEVIGRVYDFLASQKINHGVLVDRNDNPIRIGDVKKCIRLWLAELGAEEDASTIFSMGRAAGIPHHPGDSEEILKAGETIVFDIFPRSLSHGYYSDITRTWCLGYARDDVYQVYQDVHDVQTTILKQVTPGKTYYSYHQYACQEFEKRGYPTMSSNPATEEGFVHPLGHGVGLDVHELPVCGNSEKDSPLLESGMVITIEPGLYFPEKGLGVRIEDTVLLQPDGNIEILGDFPKDLVIPLKNESGTRKNGKKPKKK